MGFQEQGISTPDPAGFWGQNQPGFRFSSAPVGSKQFFAEVERHRYRLESHIPSIVRFERWANRDVLEVGCGIATDGISFARAGARYVGVDINEAPLRLARRRFSLEQLEGRFAQASASALPFDDDSVDLVFSHGVLHHLPDTSAAIGEIRRVLRPGGLALVMLYHRNSLNYWFTIMTLRRALVLSLFSRKALRLISRLTGEDAALLAGHRSLLQQHGLRYIVDKALFLSNNTDGPGNPLSKVYSRADARRLFRDFTDVKTTTRFLNVRIFPYGDKLSGTPVARRLEHRIGWHLYVSARKPPITREYFKHATSA